MSRGWTMGLAVALVAFAIGSFAGNAQAAGPPAKIRTGGPSAPGDPKVAIIASDKDPVGKRFTVVDSGGDVVLRGRVKRARGNPSPWKHAGRIDWSGVERAGSYRIKAVGLTSPRWRVSANARHSAIGRMLRIFEVNADGAEPNPVFGPSHLNDSSATIIGGPTAGQTVDVAGGWRDAGDAIKFTYTTAMASVLLEYASILSPEDGARIAPLSDIGLRWLVKAHPAGSQTFIAQVSDESDHGGPTTFRDFATDDASPNPAFSDRRAYGEAGSGTLGSAAAALAAGALRAGPQTQTGQALMALALEWYNRGKALAAPGPRLGAFDQPGGNGFSDWQGFMALAAVTLYRAGAGDALLDDANAYLAQANVEGGFSVYFSVGGLAAADMCGGMGRPAVPRQDVRDAACARLAEAISAARFRAGQNAFRSPGGFYFGWVADHTGSAFLEAAGERAGIVKNGFLDAFEARDYLFGRNPWGASFVLGPGAREAKHPHHPVVIKGSPPQLGNGFIVGGPARKQDFDDFDLTPKRTSPFFKFNPTYDPGSYGPKVIYEDRTANFITSEVGLGYSAPAIVLLAQLDSGG